MKIQIPDFIRPLFGQATWRKNPSSKVIYLTFDDGPVPEVTPEVLEILDYYGLKATFFCVGNNVSKYPHIYQDILQRGHSTGNHTFSHLNGRKTKSATYLEDTRKAAKLIDSHLFRPPHGLMKPWQRKTIAKEYEIILWDVLTLDYDRNLSAEKIMQNIKRYTRNGSIIVFHDSIKAAGNMLEVLPRALEFWKKEGYGFDVL